jgi:hypothetical protein
MLEARGFDLVWINWIRQVVEGGSLGIMVNGEESAYFKPGKGLRQGGSFIPIFVQLSWRWVIENA